MLKLDPGRGARGLVRAACGWTLGLILTLGLSGPVAAQTPPDTGFQGLLLDAQGIPLPGPVDLELSIFDAATQGVLLYRESFPSTALRDGLFHVWLGTGQSPQGVFDATLFAGPDRWLEIAVAGERLEPRQPLSTVPFAFQSDNATFATNAANAERLDGRTAEDLDASDHVAARDNPHGVTAAQVGAVSEASVDQKLLAHAGQSSAHHAKTTRFEELIDVAADQQIPNEIARDVEFQSADAALEARVDGLLARIEALEALLAGVSRSGERLEFAGVNLHVTNGTGATARVNGLGNLILGYDEDRAEPADRTGSHNLVVGRGHAYASYSGIVAGEHNAIAGPFASVLGGSENVASGQASSVLGGQANEAAGSHAAVSGGTLNRAEGAWTSVAGGGENVALGKAASVSGGRTNQATGGSAWIGGGLLNTASGDAAGVSGGTENVASGDLASVSGGKGNAAEAVQTWVGGGLYNQAEVRFAVVMGGYDNRASGEFASIVGGESNRASGHFSGILAGLSNESSGLHAGIVAGSVNIASGNRSAVLGGNTNFATGSQTTVSGGISNLAEGWGANVSGGRANRAEGARSTVGGGELRTAAGEFDWTAGSLFEDF